MTTDYFEMARKIVHEVWNQAVIYARAEENQELTVRPEPIASQEAREAITTALLQVRQETICECAKVANKEYDYFMKLNLVERARGVNSVVSAIRALGEKP